MLEAIKEINSAVNSFIWGVPAMICIIGVGLYLSFATGFLQIRTVGTGNIAGVAGAIAIGGPGAVFWVWISAYLGMCTKFSEVTLAVHFREKNKQGDYVGGPMYYIKNGLGKKWMWLAYLFAFFGIMTVFGTGNATQVNTIVTSVDTALLNFQLISKNNLATFVLW